MEKILEEGTKSPRTIRLAALHLTGLWLAYPSIIKFYMKELKLLTLYGSGMSLIFKLVQFSLSVIMLLTVNMWSSFLSDDS